MIAPLGITRSPVIGGGDCRKLIMLFRSSDVASGEGWLARGWLADGVRRCLVRYEADRGSTGRELPCWGWWKDGRRLPSGDEGPDDAGDRCDGGV